MMKSEIGFSPHCDDPCCDLGLAWFNCPVCCDVNYNYDDLWWGTREWEKQSNVSISCHKCKAKLIASKDQDGFWFVEEISE